MSLLVRQARGNWTSFPFQEIVLQEAKRKAIDAGAMSPQVSLSYEDTHVKDEVDGELFLESIITATAIGAACDWKSESGV